MVGLVVWGAAAAVLYARVLVNLAANWQNDATYSHGWLVAPVAVALLWRQRDRLRLLPLEPSPAGLALLALSLAVYAAGTLGAELFLTRISLIGVLAGSLLFAAGWKHLRIAAFPLAFLIFMIPLPAVIFDRIAVELQLVASTLGERMLQSADVAVLRDGNVLRLATVSLEVNEACSGIRSLMTLVSITTLMAYVLETGWTRRLVIAAGAVPLAVGLNGVRIAATGLAALRFGPRVAEGAVHEATGFIVFLAALACMCAIHLAMHRGTVSPPARAAAEAA